MTAMHTRSGVRSLRSALLSTALAALLTIGFAASVRGDDGERVDRKVLDAILGGIGFKREKPTIEYRERGPLVVPPSRELPAPRNGDLAATANPAWPKDQDVRRAEDWEQARKKGKSWDEWDDWTSGRDLTPSELKNRRTSSAGNRTVTSSSTSGGDDLKPSELGFTGWTWKKFFGKDDDTETASFKEEPPRQTLVEPPPGYRTPSPDQLYGVSKSTQKNKPYNVWDKDTHKPYPD